jgi:CheY-like chemotaxis protein
MKKILIVDDDASFVEAISTLLETQEYEIITASGGKEGFEKAKKVKPDLMLLDVMMARKTEGFDVARNLKKDNATKNIPVIMITGIRSYKLPFELEPDEDWLPVTTILEKPVKPEELLKAIEENIKK